MGTSFLPCLRPIKKRRWCECACISSLRKALIKWQPSLFSTAVGAVVICGFTGAMLVREVLLRDSAFGAGGREERGREKGIRFLDSAFSGGLVFFFFSE